jgi:hypothetical protein
MTESILSIRDAAPGPPVRGLFSRLTVVLVLVSAGCRTLEPPRPPEAAQETPSPTPDVQPSPAETSFEVTKVEEEVVVAAWAEPKRLPAGGGQAQIVVRLQKRGGKPFPGVEVRLRCSVGTLYSRGRILVTDARGMTRDRLTTRLSSTITLNAGGTRYRFRVPLGDEEEDAPDPVR